MVRTSPSGRVTGSACAATGLDSPATRTDTTNKRVVRTSPPQKDHCTGDYATRAVVVAWATAGSTAAILFRQDAP
nr:hypothetical protein GCM10017745_55990 [Saccharothrix mutabilis subsp. capreolus]